MTCRASTLADEPLPAELQPHAESLRLTTRDGESLGAWYLPGDTSAPLILLLHGNTTTRASCVEQAKFLHSLGSPVLLLTQRAHGDSTGSRNDFGYSARHDVIAAVDWLAAKHPARPIIVFGQSMGSAASLFASEELGDRVKGYILECPYTDLRTAVRNRTRHYLPPVLDHLAYAGLMLMAPLVLPHHGQISPLQASASVPANVPVLILAGGIDRRATVDEARAIASRMARAEVIVFEKADHTQLLTCDCQKYHEVITRFVTTIQPGK